MSELSNRVTGWSDEVMKSYHWIDKLLLEQKGTKKVFQVSWQANKYILNNKMYAYIGFQDKLKRPILTLKLDPMFSDMLRSKYNNIVEGYYMNKVNWSTIYLDGSVPEYVIKDVVASSYQLLLSTLSKKSQKEILEE